MNKNYADETIPTPAELVEEAKQHAEKIGELRKYSFSELFTEIENKGKTEYHRNTSIWSKEIGENNDLKGLYIFYEDDKPIYVGISRCILKRLKNHFLGKVHNEATLVYLMLRDKHDQIHGVYTGVRLELKIFKEERESEQAKMRKNWKIAIIPEEDSYKMHFFEIYLSCYLKTKWNSFETH